MFLGRVLLRLLLGVVILVAVVAVVGDLLARSEAQKVLANRVRAATSAQSVSVHIGSFPFLYEVLFGQIADVKVVADGVPVGALRLTEVDVDAKQVKLDRHTLLFDQRVQVTSIGSATVTIILTSAVLAPITNLLDASVSVAGGHELVVSSFGHPVLSVDLTRSRLIPDCAFSIGRIAQGYRLSCLAAPVPARDRRDRRRRSRAGHGAQLQRRRAT
jgi:hypothetical protein